MPLPLSRASVVRRFLPRSSVSSTAPSSHILIRCSTRRSTTRRATDFISSVWGMLPKNPRGRHRRLPGVRETAVLPPRPPPAGRSARPVGVLFGWKIGFKDRFQNQRCRRHADPIPHARDAQRPQFAVGLRYKHSSDWLWPVGLLPERKRQFSQPSLNPVCLDIRKILAVDPRRALVGAALGTGMRQNVVAANLVVQSVETIAGLRLRFRV